MLTPPERRTPPKCGWHHSASTTFSKSGHFIPGNEGSQDYPFCCSDPLRPATPRRLPPGGVPKCLQISSKKHFLSQSRCVAGRRFLSKLLQIAAASLLGPPLAASNTSKVASGQGGAKRLQICSKIHFLSKLRCVAGPALWSKLIQNEASSLLGPPFRPEIRRRLPLGFSWAALGLLLAAPGLLLAAPGLLLAPPGLLLTHTSIRTSHLEGSRAGRCILRRRDSRCVVS